MKDTMKDTLELVDLRVNCVGEKTLTATSNTHPTASPDLKVLAWRRAVSEGLCQLRQAERDAGVVQCNVQGLDWV